MAEARDHPTLSHARERGPRKSLAPYSSQPNESHHAIDAHHATDLRVHQSRQMENASKNQEISGSSRALFSIVSVQNYTVTKRAFDPTRGLRGA